MAAVSKEELSLPKPYSQVELGQQAGRAARRLAVLLGVAAVAFLAYGLLFAEMKGTWAAFALAQGFLAWKLPGRSLAAVALTALEVILGVLLPVRAIGLAVIDKPGFPLLPTLAIGGVVLAAALWAAPKAILLLRDQDLREAYVSLD